MTSPRVLRAEALSCTRSGTQVLTNITLDVPPASLVGLLGPNGAGKSSLLLCLAGLLRPSQGRVSLGNKPLTAHSRRALGIAFQDPSLDPALTARANLKLAAALHGIRGEAYRDREETLVQLLELSDVLDTPVKRLSGGFKRRVDLARAMLHRPEILLLDEPANGLDPVAAEQLWGCLDAMRAAEGTAMLLSTHHASEAEGCDTLMLLDRGHCVGEGSPDVLLGELAPHIVAVDTDAPDALGAALGVPWRVARGELILSPTDPQAVLTSLAAETASGAVSGFSLRRPSLADVFIAHTGGDLTDTRSATEAS